MSEGEGEIERELDQLRARCSDLEARLAHADRRYSLVLEATNDGVWDWDLVHDEVTFSRRWKSILGYEEDEVEDSSAVFFSLVHPADAPRVQEAVERHWRARVPYDVEFRMRGKSGEYRYIRARGQAEWDETGRPVRMAGTHTDVTDLRTQAIERVRAQELIEIQRATIRTLGTPILKLGGGVLCLPIIGAVDDVRAAEMTSALLDEVARSATRCVVIDLTGAAITRELGAPSFLRKTLSSIALIGAKGAVCGVSVALAQLMVEEALDFGDVELYRDLGEALRSIKR